MVITGYAYQGPNALLGLTTPLTVDFTVEWDTGHVIGTSLLLKGVYGLNPAVLATSSCAANYDHWLAVRPYMAAQIIDDTVVCVGVFAQPMYGLPGWTQIPLL